MSDFSRLMEAARGAGVAVTAPANVDVPAISGTGMVGEVLACTMGNWSGEPTGYAYQWMSDGVNPLGTNAADYGVTVEDVGHSLTCTVTASNAAGSAAAPPSNAIVIDAGTREAPSAQHAERQRSKERS
jgi:hypothetical protein